MKRRSRHEWLLLLKRFVYKRYGEPYRMQGNTLRFLPGTRPIRLKHLRSKNGVARNDALQIRLFSSNIVEGDTVIDIGAHCGQYAILMAALCGQTGRVIAFEPDPYARHVLLHNLKLNPLIKPPVVESYAVAETDGEAVLFSRGGNSQSSLVRSGVEFSGSDKSEAVPVVVRSLDSYLFENRVPAPRWVKIDAEGAEIKILMGARRLLSSNAGIVCELHPYAWPEFGDTFSDLKTLAAASGRRIRYLDPSREIGNVAEYGTVILERQS